VIVTLHREAAVIGTLVSFTDARVIITIGIHLHHPSLRKMKHPLILSDNGDGTSYRRTIADNEVVEENGVALAPNHTQVLGQSGTSNNVQSITRYNTWHSY
jgi:hypothetical protein